MVYEYLPFSYFQILASTFCLFNEGITTLGSSVENTISPRSSILAPTIDLLIVRDPLPSSVY